MSERRENNLDRCPECGAPAGFDCRTIQGRIPPHEARALRHHSWIGDDHPVEWARVGTIDVADPADVRLAIDRGYRIGSIYDGMSFSVAEPCAADIYAEIDSEEDTPS